jgi:hypothetical protein
MLRALALALCVSLAVQTSSAQRAVYAYGDFDQDGDVDLDDFEVLCGCFGGPDVSYDPPLPDCTLAPNDSGFLAADADRDGDVDVIDFISFQTCYSGAGNPADPSCAPWSDVTEIILNGDSIIANGSCVTVEGTTATITCEGTYIITGTLDDGQIVVDALDLDVVELILNGVDISNSTNAPIYAMNAGNTTIALADQTANYLSDADTYQYPDPNDPEPDAALFSKDPLTISGPGALTVHGNYLDAIAGKDEVIITGGAINVIAADDGIRGRDYLLIQDGDITVTSQGDGLKATNDEDPALGYITIERGSFQITSGGDAIAAETDVTIAAGDFTILSGGGHTVTIPEDVSAKGIKGGASVAIGGGTFDMDCADDGVHSNDDVTISGATLTIATNSDITAAYGDGIHADDTTHIVNGTITITSCYEGIEGGNVTIDDGDIDITSADDAVDATSNVSIAGGNFTILSGGGHTVTIPSNRSAKAFKGLVSVTIGGGTFSIDAADDGVHSNNAVTISGGDLTIATNSSTSASYGDGVHADNSFHMTSGTINVTTAYEGIESKDITIDDGNIWVNTTDDGINAAGGAGLNNYMRFNGGYVAVYAQGDGLDSNGYITMTGGTVIVHGPTGNFNSAIDYDGTFNISGGFLIAAGSAGMAQAPSPSSTQRSIKITYATTKPAGTLAHLETTNTPHTYIFTFAPSKQYRSLVFSSPALTQGTSYDLYSGGSCTGTPIDGLYSDGTYSGGTRTNTFTITNIVTNVNAP